MAETPDLSEQQERVVRLLPASKQEIANELCVSGNTVKSYIERLRDKDVGVGYDSQANAYHLIDEERVRRVSTKHTGTKTKEANNWATEAERAVLRRLKRHDPLVATPTPDPTHEDVVAHLTDVHMGDVVEDERGREVFNPEIAETLVDHFSEKVVELTETHSPAEGVDTCHLLWGGDMLTNENIYDGQAHDIQLMLADQMSAIVNCLTKQAVTLANHFDTLQIIAQPGNHGKTRASGVSKQANMDLICYRWVEDRLAERGLENVNFKHSEATFYRNFKLRGGEWRGHLRHGQDAYEHIDATSASKKKWRGWREEHRFDLAYFGHYHQRVSGDVMNQYPVMMSPSMKPGDEFASKIGSPDVSAHRQLGTVHGCSDERPLTWKYTVDDRSLEAQ